jgi:hypothetical protein
LKRVEDYVHLYSPDSIPNTGISSLSIIPDRIESATNTLGQVNKIEQEEYLTLVFVKLYRSHLQCCHQSYAIRDLYTKEKLLDLFGVLFQF